MMVNGAKVAEGQLPKTIPFADLTRRRPGPRHGCRLGRGFTYKLPFKFTGKIEKVTIELK